MSSGPCDRVAVPHHFQIAEETGTTRPAHDPTALGATLLLLTVAAVASSIGPAWKASRVDPVRAIRGD